MELSRRRNRRGDGERARAAFAAGGRIDGEGAHRDGNGSTFRTWTALSKAMVFTRERVRARTRTTRRKSALCWTRRATAAPSADSGNICWSRRSDRGGARLDIQTMGPRAAGNHGRGSRRPLDKRARRTDDLHGTLISTNGKIHDEVLDIFCVEAIDDRNQESLPKSSEKKMAGACSVDSLVAAGMKKKK